MALRNIRSMDDVVAASIADSRFETRLLTIFAALALLLAAVGTYGVLAYDVAARTHELGVRVALGAVSDDVVRVVVRRTLALVIPGLAARADWRVGRHARASEITLRGHAHRSGDTRGCFGRPLAGGVDRRPRADAPSHAHRSDDGAPERVAATASMRAHAFWQPQAHEQ